MSRRGDLLSKSRSARLGIACILALLFGTIFFCALEVGHPAQAQSSPHYVGLVTDEGTLADRSFNWLAYQGLLRAEAELDVVGTVYTSTSSADYAPNLQQCVDDGNDLCLSVGFLTADAIWTAALDNPTTSFAILDHEWAEAYPANLRSLTFAMDEAGYLAGTLAAEMTANDAVGVVGGIPVPSVVEYVEGYRSGARCANPNVNVFLDYAGSFTDPEYGAHTTQWMLDNGADVIFAAAGQTGNGAILTATQSGAWGIGVDIDQYITLFENGAVAGADHLLSSAMKHLDNGVYATIADLVAGTFTAGTVRYDLAADGVGLAPFHEADPSVPQSVRDALAAAEQGIVSGTIDVYDPCQTPNLSARPSHQQVHAYNWPLWSMVTLTLDDPDIPGAPDYTDTQQVTLADWDPAQHFASFDLPVPLEPGQVVTLTNGTYTKVHVVEPLSVTVVDPDTDVVSGAAESGSDVTAWACDDWGCTGRHEVADVDGNWAADFSVVGDEDWEQETFDIQPGHWGDANVTDLDGDDTLVSWSLPNPRFGVWPDEERVDGWDWQSNATVTVSVDGTVETAVSDEWGNFSINLPAPFDLQTGHVVTVSDGVYTKTHTVVPLTVDTVDPNVDTISGTAQPDGDVNVWACDEWYCIERHEIVDGGGNWAADFSVVGDEDWEQETFDILPGHWGDAKVTDDDGDQTIVNWSAANPRLAVRPEDENVDGWEWPSTVPITLTVDDDGDPGNGTLWTELSTSDEGGNVSFSLHDAFDLQPGHWVSLDDGATVKTHTIALLTVDLVDPDTDTVHGTAAPDTEVEVQIWDWDGPWRRVTADGSGNWMADFSVPGAEDDRTYDVGPGSQGAAVERDDDGDETQVQWRVPNSHFAVRPGQDRVDGWEWQPNATITVTIDGQAATTTSDAWGNFGLDLYDQLDLQAGQLVTVSDGATTKTHTVTALTVTEVDPATDVVSGTAAGESQVWVQICHDWGCVQREEFADGSGNWAADFSQPGDREDEQETYDIQLGTSGDAAQHDEDGDRTEDSWRVLDPRFSVRLTDDQIQGDDWPLDATVTLTIEDPSTPESPDYVASSTVGQADWDSQQTWVGFNLRPDDFEIGAGQLVTMTDGETTKSHVVAQLTIDDVDVEADAVSGTAQAGLEIRVEACNDWGCAVRHATADATGFWSADFSIPGGGDDEQDTLDIAMNAGVNALWTDGDNDSSQVSWQLSNPHFRVWLDSNQIHGYQWPLEIPVTVTVDDPSSGPGVDYTDTQLPTSDYCCGTWVGFYLPDSLPIGPGWTVTATNGEVTKTHTVFDGLSFGGADVETDVVTGTAAPDSTLSVGICWTCYCESREVTADGSGFWLADFSVPGEWGRTYDIVAGTDGEVYQNDDEGDGTGIFWSIPNPRIEAIPDENRVEGREWEEGAAVTLTVDGYAETQTAQIAHWNPDETTVEFNLWGIVDLQPGTVITLTDGATTKVHTITGLAIDSVDADIDTIFGRADPNSEVRIWIHNTGGEFTATADENGDWSFDFTGIFDLVPGTEGETQQSDGDGDVTRVHWRVPRPYLEAWAGNDRVEGADWPDGTAVTLTIDDPSNGPGVDFTDTQTAYVPPWDPSRTRVDFDLWDRFDLEPGHIVTLSDGATTKTHVVTPLTIAGADPDTDVVWGTATPEGEVRLWVNNTPGDFTATADGSGNWSIDLAGVIDLTLGAELGAQESDDDGDATRADLRIPNPIIMARPAEDRVEGYQWPLDAALTLTIGGLGADYTDTQVVGPCDLPWGSTNAGFEIPFDLRAGHVLTLTDGATLRSHTITSLTIETIDADNDTVSGQAEPFSEVRILSEAPWNWVERQVTADAAGDWMADFSGAADIGPGSGGWAWQEDEAGNQTLVNWQLRNPNFDVRFTDHQVHGYDWPLGAIVTMAIDDPATPDAPDYTVSAAVGPAEWNPEETWVVLPLGDFSPAPGDTVSLTDGAITKTHAIIPLEVTDVNVDADTVSGITDPGLDVEVCIWEMDAPCRQVTADGDGNWTADFATPQPWDDRTFDLVGGTQGEVRARDDDGDATQTGWSAPGGYPSPRPPLVVPVGSSPDLDYHRTYDGDSLMILAQLMEGLYRHRADGSLEAAGATGYTVSSDATVYTVTLRADAAWSDGAPVTAQHYVDGVERGLRPELEGGYAAGLLTQLSVSATAVDTHTLRFTCPQPAAHFPAIMASPALYPARLDVIDGDPEWTAAGHFVGNGPYTLIENGNYYLVEKNPFYHTAAATVDQIAFVIIPGSAEQLDAYQRGEVDVVLMLDDNNARDVYDDPQLSQALVISPRPGVSYIGLNVQRGPTDQALVRQALASAIDRQTIVSDALGLPWRETATSVIPPTIPGYQNGAVGYPFDVAQAQAYLAAAGGGPLEIVLRAPLGNEAMVDPIAQMWRDHLGITVTTIYQNWSSDYLPYLQGCQGAPGACDYNAYRLGWIVDYADAHNLLNDVFHPDSTGQFTGWDSQAYRDQVNLAAAEPDAASRIAYLQEADRILVEEETALIPLFYYDRASLVRPGIVYEIPAVGGPHFMDWRVPGLLTVFSGQGPFAWRNLVHGYDWPEGATLTLSIDDPTTGATPDHTLSAPVYAASSWMPQRTAATFDLNGVIDIGPGLVVTLTDGDVTLVHTVTDLAVTTVDPDTDRISGTAAPGSEVYVPIFCGLFDQPTCAFRHEIADASGYWTADFSISGDEEGEETYDIAIGTRGQPRSPVLDRAATVVRFAVPTSPPAGFTPTPTVTVAAGEPIQLAVAVALDGDLQNLTRHALQAVDMALEDHGAVLGFDVISKTFDGGCDLSLGEAAASAVINEAENVAVVGHFCSSSAVGAMPLYEEAGVVAVSGSATMPEVAFHGPTVFNRTVVDDFADSENWIAALKALPSVQAWTADYEARYGETPADYAVLYYDAARLLLTRIGEVATPSGDDLVIDRAALAAAVRGTSDYVGTSGLIRFDPWGNRLNLGGDADGDGVLDTDDNAPFEYNPDQLDVDDDGVADVLDPCPNDPDDTCDPDGSASASIGPDGGTVATADGKVTISIPAGALADDTSISITDAGSQYTLTNDLGAGFVVFGVDITPDGTTFDVPVTMTFAWEDADDDGVVDGTSLLEADLRIIKDGVSITELCATDVGCDPAANTFTFQVTSLSRFELVGPVDGDDDGVPDDWDGIVDACPLTPGLADRQGCRVGILTSVDLHIVDQAKSGACPGGAGSCRFPLEGAAVRVFDRGVIGNPHGSTYDQVFESGSGLIGACKTDGAGSCTAGLESTADVLIIVKHEYEDGTFVYTGRPLGIEDFADTDSDGQGDLVAKSFQIIQVLKRNGDVQFSGGSKTVVTGSYLEIIYPDEAIWEDALGGYVYPFIFTSDSEWEVDICGQVPEGYEIRGVYDEEGNLVSETNCTQAFVAYETRVVAFDVVEVGSPEPFLAATLHVRGGHAGTERDLELGISGTRLYKDRPEGTPRSGLGLILLAALLASLGVAAVWSRRREATA